MRIKSKYVILLLLGLAVVCAGAFWLIQSADTGTVATISVDGEVIEKIDLSKVKESYEIEIDTEYGHNVILVEPGAISVLEADCPDQICVKQGKMTGGGVPIVCMPHRVVIEIGGSGIDA